VLNFNVKTCYFHFPKSHVVTQN